MAKKYSRSQYKKERNANKDTRPKATLRNARVSTTKAAFVLDAIQQNTETGAGVEASIRIPPNTLPIGTSVGVQIETSKKMYSGCIPLEALHQEEGNQYYVYTTDEKKTILGTEVIARRVDVTVEYKGDRYAAVKGLSVNQNIILSSSKQISDGGRIKPQKQ